MISCQDGKVSQEAIEKLWVLEVMVNGFNAIAKDFKPFVLA